MKVLVTATASCNTVSCCGCDNGHGTGTTCGNHCWSDNG